MSNLVANRIMTPDGTMLQSFHRHDYVTHLDENGETYMVDGGLEYTRRTITKAPFAELSVYDTDPFELVRQSFHWGTRGKDGKQPLKWVALKDLDTDHIEAIIDTQTHVKDYILALFRTELKWRQR